MEKEEVMKFRMTEYIFWKYCNVLFCFWTCVVLVFWFFFFFRRILHWLNKNRTFWYRTRKKNLCLSLRIFSHKLSCSAPESGVLTIRLSCDRFESGILYPIFWLCVLGISKDPIQEIIGHNESMWGKETDSFK